MADDIQTQDPASPHHAYPCAACGARIEFAAGTAALRCPYCGHEQAIAPASREVREHAYADLSTLPRKPVASIGTHVLHCQRCGARTESNALASRCPFCAAPVVVDAAATGQIVPEAVLPFRVDRDGVRTALRGWVSSRWFAPSSLKQVRETESVQGTYLPHWTFDARTVTDYRGQRGEHYWVTETYTVQVNGRSETRTRQVRRTRWYDARGTVRRDFDDVLVPATTHLNPAWLSQLTPWPLREVVPYQPDFLAGHQAQRYDTEPEAGLAAAKEQMVPVIREDCRRDIGGDEQRVAAMDTGYSEVTYKLVLLPVWLAHYLHAGKSWQVVVNGVTGEILGERPYSAVKITVAVLAALVVLGVIIAAFVYGGR